MDQQSYHIILHANRKSQAHERYHFLSNKKNYLLNNVKIGNLSIQIQGLYH